MAKTRKRPATRKRALANAAGGNLEGRGLDPQEIQQALTLLHQNRKGEAEILFAGLLRRQPRPPALVNQLGVLAHLLGRAELALDLLQRSVSQEPSAPLLNNLGLVREQQGDLSAAHIAYSQALQADPNFAEAHYNLGNVLQKERHYAEAMEEYRQAINLRPDYPGAYHNLACAQLELGGLEEAERSCLEAVRLNPAFGAAISTWNRIMEQLGDPDRMLASANEMAKLVQDKVTIFASLGSILSTHGKKVEAIDCYCKALRIAPTNCKIHLLRAMVTRYRHAEDLREMEETYARTTGASDLYFLCFALGMAYEDIGDYPAAFRFIQEGNRLLRATYAYSIQADRNFFMQLKSAFPDECISRSRKHGHRDTTPIFVVGMPRSGTTLVEQILASHPQVHGAGELPDIDLVFRETLQKQGILDYPQGINELSPEEFGKMGAEYMTRLRRLSGKPRIVDKFPHNFLFLGLIRIILPDAKIIHCQRDPRDTCWSIYKNVFDTPHLYAQDQNELGQYYRLYQEIMAHWREVLPGGLFEIGYEQIIENQENETRKLLEYCGLPWDDACLNFHRAGRRVLTSSMSQVRQPIYRSSLQKWRCYEKELEPLRAALGHSQA